MPLIMNEENPNQPPPSPVESGSAAPDQRPRRPRRRYPRRRYYNRGGNDNFNSSNQDARVDSTSYAGAATADPSSPDALGKDRQ